MFFYVSGDSLLDEEDYQKRKKKVIKKKNSGLQTNNNSEDKISTNHKDTAESKKEKQNSAKKKVSKLKGQAKHLYKIKKDLGLFQNDTKNQNEKDYVNSITEVVSIDKKEGGKGKTTEVIVFNDPAKRKMKVSEQCMVWEWNPLRPGDIWTSVIWTCVNNFEIKP